MRAKRAFVIIVKIKLPDGNIVAYTYDPLGNRSKLTYPDGKAVTYVYDASNRLSQVNDWLSRPTTYSHDPSGNLMKTAYPNGASIVFSYDAANRLTGVLNSGAATSPVLNLLYTLDAVGNRTSLSANGIATKFGYDALNELVSAQLGFLKTSWNYDEVGNRLQQTEPIVGTTKYTYDADDRLLRAGSATFTYDANGNETSVARTLTSFPIMYRYDSANRLVAAKGGFVNSAYAYDGDGNRVSQSTRTGAYQYSNDIATALPVVLNEQGPDGNIDYAYGLGLIEENSAGFNYFYHYDGLRSVVALTDSLGKPQAAYAYDPWGIPLLAISDRIGTRNKFRFGGESLDQGTGLYFLRARYYDPMLGRFTKPDPYHGSAFHAISMRRFLYANNNPVRYLDPSGLLVYGVSLGIEGDVGGGVNGEVSLVYDDKGNRALAVTGGFSVGLGISGGSSLFLTNDATIDQFAGRSLSLGGSVGPLDAAVLLDSSGYFEGAVLGVAKGGLDVNISFTWTGLVGRNAWWVPGSPVNWSWVRNTLGQIESDLGSTPTNAQSIK